MKRDPRISRVACSCLRGGQAIVALPLGLAIFALSLQVRPEAEKLRSVLLCSRRTADRQGCRKRCAADTAFLCSSAARAGRHTPLTPSLCMTVVLMISLLEATIMRPACKSLSAHATQPPIIDACSQKTWLARGIRGGEWRVLRTCKAVSMQLPGQQAAGGGPDPLPLVSEAGA